MFGFKRKATQLVPQSWIDRAKRNNQFTPDVATLQQHKTILCFVYNEAMEGHRNHFKHVGNSQFCGIAYTVAHDYAMWKKNLGNLSYPIALKGLTQGPNQTTLSTKKLVKTNPAFTSEVKLSRIKGELYLLTPNQVRELDEHVQNTVQFNRVRTRVAIPYYFTKKIGDKVVLHKTVHILKPFIYLGITDYWLPLLDHGVFYSVVGQREINPEFPAFDNAFHYSVKEHNEFKGRLSFSVSKVQGARP